MNDILKVKCWNGIYGANAFEIQMWEINFNSIDDAVEYYRNIWEYVWIEDSQGNVYKSLKQYNDRKEVK